MPATPFDSVHMSALFDPGDCARLFTDSAEIRAMMIVEGALAQAQGAQGVHFAARFEQAPRLRGTRSVHAKIDGGHGASSVHPVVVVPDEP